MLSLFFWSSCVGRGRVTPPVWNRWLGRAQTPLCSWELQVTHPPTSCGAAQVADSRWVKVYLKVGNEEEEQHQRWQRMYKKRKIVFWGGFRVRTNMKHSSKTPLWLLKQFPRNVLSLSLEEARPFAVICRSSLLTQLHPSVQSKPTPLTEMSPIWEVHGRVNTWFDIKSFKGNFPMVLVHWGILTPAGVLSYYFCESNHVSEIF